MYALYRLKVIVSVFHVNKKFGDALPDSALLIVVGLILGYALSQIHVSQSLFTLKPDTFFLYLLPPIIFDAGMCRQIPASTC